MGPAAATLGAGCPRIAALAAPKARRAVAEPERRPPGAAAVRVVPTTAFFCLTSQPRTATSLTCVSELRRGQNSVTSSPSDSLSAGWEADCGQRKYRILSLT